MSSEHFINIFFSPSLSRKAGVPRVQSLPKFRIKYTYVYPSYSLSLSWQPRISVTIRKMYIVYVFYFIIGLTAGCHHIFRSIGYLEWSHHLVQKPCIWYLYWNVTQKLARTFKARLVNWSIKNIWSLRKWSIILFFCRSKYNWQIWQ